MAKGPQFRLGGIPVRIDPTFFVIIVLLGYDPINPRLSTMVSWVVIALVSILLHEMAHAVAFRHYGIRPSVTLYGMGGMTTGTGRLTPGQSIVVSAAGPLSVLTAIGLPALWLARQGAVGSAEGRVILGQVIWVNVGWSLLNLLPMLPLDGGNITRSLLDLVTRGKGRRPAEVLSVVMAVGLGLVALSAGFFFGAVLAGLFAFMNISSLARVKTEELGDELSFGHRALIEHRPADAERVAQEVLAKKPAGETLRWSSELLGWARLWQGDQAGAEAAVQRYAHAGPASASFRAARALAAGRTAEGIGVMVWAFANEPPGPSHILGAIAVAGTGQAGVVTLELLRLEGDAGVRAALLFRGLLDYAGYDREVAEVTGLLTADGRAARLPPG
jgi:stage IV sporulation protein FB